MKNAIPCDLMVAKRNGVLTVYCFYSATVFLFSPRLSAAYATTQIVTDTSDPITVASPIGNRLSGNHLAVSAAPGTRASATAAMLCTNDSIDLPHAQK